ncbi:MAG: amino acid permease [Mycoplasmataceae bacterium]|nr:amino acid permease [Mycoplasmataceae bacterium]
MKAKNITNNHDNVQGKYGLISMIAMIIGIVVASGIFVKNGEIIDTTGSAIIAMMAWVIGGLIVVCVMIGFLEITSSTKLSKEQGTVLAWSKKFLGDNFAIIIGFYITFVYLPLLTIALAFFAANYFGGSLVAAFGIEQIKPMTGFLFITFLGFGFMLFATLINSFTSKPGKVFQNVGTVIKMIPLVVVMFVAILAVFSIVSANDVPNEVFNPNSPINNINGKATPTQYLTLSLMALPAVLFSFDGFLYADSLSLEAKSENTYKNALIISMIVTILIYILYSLSTMILADSSLFGDENANPFSITTIMLNIFPNQKWIAPTLALLIMISVLVAVNGLSSALSRNIADASQQNLIRDKNGELMKRNKAMIPQNSAIRSIAIMVFFGVLYRSCDALAFNWSETNYLNGGDLAMTAVATNVAAVVMFIFYSMILAGGISNRKTKKVEVEKTRGFIFFSFVSILALISSSLFFFIILFITPLIDIIQSSDPNNLANRAYIGQVITTLFTVLFLLAIIFYNKKRIKNVDFNSYKTKKTVKWTYDNLVPYNEFEKYFYVNTEWSELIKKDTIPDYNWYIKQKKLEDEKVKTIQEKIRESYLFKKLQEKKDAAKKDNKEPPKLKKGDKEPVIKKEKNSKNPVTKTKIIQEIPVTETKIIQEIPVTKTEIIQENLVTKPEIIPQENDPLFQLKTTAKKLKIVYDEKTSEFYLNKIINDFKAITKQQLKDKFIEKGIKLKRQGTKVMMFNLMIEFDNLNVTEIQENLTKLNISFPDNQTKGELFSLLISKRT